MPVPPVRPQWQPWPDHGAVPSRAAGYGKRRRRKAGGDGNPTAEARPVRHKACGVPSGLPLLGHIIHFRPGHEMVARRSFRLSKDCFLRDHVLGGRVSAKDPSLHPLALSHTISMEILAEAASALRPDQHVVALRAVRARAGSRSNGMSGTGSWPEQRRRHGRGGLYLETDPHAPAVEGIVELASAYPEPPPSSPQLRRLRRR